MKPSWDDAPEWANYLAQDEDGEWKWFERAPFIDEGGRWESYVKQQHKWMYASEDAPYNHNWRKSLEERP